ncbi:MAG: hypothetical protein AB1657_05845 [Candidatus Micrarchaeota archaeon]
MKTGKAVVTAVVCATIAMGSCKKEFPKEPMVECRARSTVFEEALPALLHCKEMGINRIKKLLAFLSEDDSVHIIYLKSGQFQPTRQDREMAELAAERLGSGGNGGLVKLAKCGVCFDDLSEGAIDELIRRRALPELVELERWLPKFREKIRRALADMAE